MSITEKQSHCYFISAKGRSQKSKKPQNAKETNKSTTKPKTSSSAQSNARKQNGTGQVEGSASAIQTAAGNEIRPILDALFSLLFELLGNV